MATKMSAVMETNLPISGSRQMLNMQEKMLKYTNVVKGNNNNTSFEAKTK